MWKSLTVDIRRRLRGDRREPVGKIGNLIEEHLEGNNTQAAYGLLKAWYCQATGRPLKPTREDISKISDNFEELFSNHPPQGDPLPIHVQPFVISDDTPDEEEIGRAIMRLSNGKSPGATCTKIVMIYNSNYLFHRRNSICYSTLHSCSYSQNRFQPHGNYLESTTGYSEACVSMTVYMNASPDVVSAQP
jgi:hypothetical protein